jgi:hypothetical protein
MRKRLAGLIWTALLAVGGVLAAGLGAGCSGKPDHKLPPDMPKGGLKNVTPKGVVAPAPLPPPP